MCPSYLRGWLFIQQSSLRLSGPQFFQLYPNEPLCNYTEMDPDQHSLSCLFRLQNASPLWPFSDPSLVPPLWAHTDCPPSPLGLCHQGKHSSLLAVGLVEPPGQAPLPSCTEKEPGQDSLSGRVDNAPCTVCTLCMGLARPTPSRGTEWADCSFLG